MNILQLCTLMRLQNMVINGEHLRQEINKETIHYLEMATKSSHDTLETFKDILNDIDDITDDEPGNKLLVNIKNTMSDRASTETKFNELLQEYRNQTLPEVIGNYEQLCEEEKLSVSRMNNLFCGLHTLVHMADTAQKTVYETEKLHFEDGVIPILNKSFEKTGQPETSRLILTACKAFARRGDPKSGCHGNFLTFISDFLKEHNMSFPLQPLKGNIFNILFTNLGHVYYFHDLMKEFLDKSPSLNGLLLSVQKDLAEPFFLTGCKALGLISKNITTPLWRVIEKKIFPFQ
ncbi:LOW QUALITY PROTEIN: hypothetical protein MAR_021378 [Mya arenaria]|uniref:Uncharacterized protein n=1 Tax=Mya arenaria TaxID=6604 RepID=A0ABY7EA48_MYAAR|nr:LOW QUALITY PROTEIN: hypothetical protein MAR_021378 [Mya arenaria]